MSLNQAILGAKICPTQQPPVKKDFTSEPLYIWVVFSWLCSGSQQCPSDTPNLGPAQTAGGLSPQCPEWAPSQSSQG